MRGFKIKTFKLRKNLTKNPTLYIYRVVKVERFYLFKKNI